VANCLAGLSFHIGAAPVGPTWADIACPRWPAAP
jgi:hypothetical protein